MAFNITKIHNIVFFVFILSCAAEDFFRTIGGHFGGVSSLAVLPDGTLASGSVDYTIKIWNTTTGEEIRTLIGHSHGIASLAVLPDGKLASCAVLEIKIWNTQTGEEIRTFTGHFYSIYILVVLPDGTLASGSADKTIKIWNAETGNEIRTLTGHSGRINYLAVLPDETLASGSADNTIKIWNTETGNTIRTLMGHSNSVGTLAVLPDGTLASGSMDNTIKIWNTETRKTIRTLTGHTSGVRSLVVLPDATLASGSWDNTIKIWNTETGQVIRTFTGFTDDVLSLAVLPDGTLASGSEDRTIKFWCPQSFYCTFGSFKPIICPAGNFCPIASASPTPCPNNAICPTNGLAFPLALPGYYWVNTNNEVMPCSPTMACKGNNTCSLGYTNIRCARCDSKYFRNEDNECQECPELNWAVVVLLVTGIIFFVAVLLIVKKYNIKLIAFMVLLGFAQVLATFKFFNLNWPNPVNFSLNFMSFFNIDVNVVNPGCMQWLQWGIKTQFTLFHVAASIAFLGLCFSCGNSTVINICVLALRILHIPLVKSALTFLDCDPDSNVLEADPSIECGSGEHKVLRVFGILSLIFFGFGIIIMFYWMLDYNKSDIKEGDQESEVFNKYGRLYEGCKPERYYWRIVVMIRQTMMIFISIMISTKPVIQAILAISTLALFLGAQIKMKPFVDPKAGVSGAAKNDNIKESSKMASGILGFFYFLFQDKMDENIAQLEEVGTQILVLLSGIGFNSSSSQGVVYNLFGAVVAALVAIVFVHFSRMTWKDIRSNTIAQAN